MRLGFVFYEKSPRRVTADAAKAIIADLPAKIEKMGVFVNETVDRVHETIVLAGLTAVQLHGDEDAEFSRALFRKLAKGLRRPTILRAYAASIFDKPADQTRGMGSGRGRIGGTRRGLQRKARAKDSRGREWRSVSRDAWLSSGSNLRRPARFVHFAAARRDGPELRLGTCAAVGGRHQQHQQADRRGRLALRQCAGSDSRSASLGSGRFHRRGKAPGKKDPKKMREFVQAVREADEITNHGDRKRHKTERGRFNAENHRHRSDVSASMAGATSRKR